MEVGRQVSFASYSIPPSSAQLFLLRVYKEVLQSQKDVVNPLVFPGTINHNPCFG